MNIIFKLTYFLIIMTIFNTTYANVEISNHVTKNGIKVLYTRSANIPMIDIKITFDAGSSKDGELKGLSIEGYFTDKMEQMSEKAPSNEEILAALNEIIKQNQTK